MTSLFREKREWFRYFFFPTLMKAIGSYVTQNEAGERLAQVIDDDVTKKSGVYWSWNGEPWRRQSLSLQKAYRKPTESLQKAYRKPTESLQKAYRKPTESLQEAYRKPTGSLQEAYRKPTGSLQEAYRKPTGSHAPNIAKRNATSPMKPIEPRALPRGSRGTLSRQLDT